MRQLVDAAHAVGLYVIFDIVLNHTGDVFAYQDGSQTGFHAQPQPVFWRDATGAARPNVTDLSGIANPSRDALVWPRELQRNEFFRRQGEPPRATIQ